MKWYRKSMIMTSLIVVSGLVVVTAALNFIIIANTGKTVPVPDIPRDIEVLGKGDKLRYVVLGDSTAVGQGGDYSQGIARLTAQHIADSNQKGVGLQNFAVSGARVNDVLQKQLPMALSDKPDVVLISIGANDVTHLTKLSNIEKDMNAIFDAIMAANPAAEIIITGSPQMGSVPRFPEPTKYLASLRTASINRVFNKVSSRKQVTFAKIAEKTGPIFDKHPEYFAQDKFHPLTVGYLVWVPVLNEAIDTALQ